MPIANAAAARDALLKQATGSAFDHGQVVAWKADTGLNFAGSAVRADATTVSGFQSTYSKPKQSDVLAFAVADTKGQCAGGVLVLNAAATKAATAAKVSLAGGAACTGDAALAAAGY